MLRDARRIEKKKTSLRDCEENVAYRVDFILDSFIQLIDSENENLYFVRIHGKVKEKATQFLSNKFWI